MRLDCEDLQEVQLLVAIKVAKGLDFAGNAVGKTAVVNLRISSEITENLSKSAGGR